MITVTPGVQYVLFASINKGFEQCTNNYILEWGAVDDSVYSNGTFVFQNNSGDENQWTTTAWSTSGIDLEGGPEPISDSRRGAGAHGARIALRDYILL